MEEEEIGENTCCKWFLFSIKRTEKEVFPWKKKEKVILAKNKKEGSRKKKEK